MAELHARAVVSTPSTTHFVATVGSEVVADNDVTLLASNLPDNSFGYFLNSLTQGFVEGKNTRTKAIIRQAYGYRNLNNLNLRILLPCA